MRVSLAEGAGEELNEGSRTGVALAEAAPGLLVGVRLGLAALLGETDRVPLP